MAQQQQPEAAVVEARATQARDIAARFLARWKDPVTLNFADDLAQLTTLGVLAYYDGMHDRRAIAGFVRTIARRVRFKLLHRERNRCARRSDFSPSDLPAPKPIAAKLQVSARWVAREQLLPWLDEALDRLPPLNSRLLREYYGGSSCRDLAARYRLSPDTVKVRLYRSRERVRATLERRVSLSLA